MEQNPLDWEMRSFVYAYIVEHGLPPLSERAADEFGIETGEARAAYERLHERHALFLDPQTREVRMAFPFSAIPTQFRVRVDDRWYWANCAWDMLGVPAALHSDAEIVAEYVGAFTRGFLIGLSIAAAVGPISLLCIRKTLTEGRLAGFVSGMGAATADGLYGCVAAFGLTWVSDTLVDQRLWLHLLGGLFLVYLGARTFSKKPAETADSTAPPDAAGLAKSYASTFALTVANPMTILSFAAIFAGLGLGGSGKGYASASLLVAGVFSGSALWWLLLSVGVGIARSRLSHVALRWINVASGALILGFGAVSLVGLWGEI